MRIALYRASAGTWFDKAIDMASGGHGYSHSEIVFNGMGPGGNICYSSSVRDSSYDSNGKAKKDGTRFKIIGDRRNFQEWDLGVSLADERIAFDFAYRTPTLLDARYDWNGAARFALPWMKEHPTKYFCSEVCWELMQMAGVASPRIPGFKVSPNDLGRMAKMGVWL
jgi:hypothetical protein